MHESDIQVIEVELLLEAIYRRYGYDFRSYARASIERRVLQFLPTCGCETIGELIPRLLHDRAFFSQLVQRFSIPVTEMFRDPLVYRAIRRLVAPMLSTWPHVKVWHAGCASGEEAYSMAVVLEEEGLLSKTTIYATDFNESALERAREGIYAVERLQQATRQYQESGGTHEFADYYHARYNAVALAQELKQRIVFANHNLVTDASFGEMHFVLCRNVLIYFDRDLQNRVLQTITDSLVRGGFLCIGTKEDLLFSSVAEHYEVVDKKARIYKKRMTA